MRTNGADDGGTTVDSIRLVLGVELSSPFQPCTAGIEMVQSISHGREDEAGWRRMKDGSSRRSMIGVKGGKQFCFFRRRGLTGKAEVVRRSSRRTPLWSMISCKVYKVYGVSYQRLNILVITAIPAPDAILTHDPANILPECPSQKIIPTPT